MLDIIDLLVLKGTRQRPNKRKIYGFDCETFDKNKTFYCCSIVGDNYRKTFFNKRDVIEEFSKKRFRSAVICATNLGFDFHALFYGEPELNKSFPLYRGSDLILAYLYFCNGKYLTRAQAQAMKKKAYRLQFLDTLNYAKLSVKQIGQMIGIEKLESPDFEKKPQNQEEIDNLVHYNIRDAEISYKFLKLIFKKFFDLGATPQVTIASTALSLWKNTCLKDVYFRHPKHIIKDLFNAYYGGRCEVVKRGISEDFNYYDINSLYPDVMINDYPDPNSIRETKLNDRKYIVEYPGVSHVLMLIPCRQYPYLPTRYDGKLLFPYGVFSGWWTHYEISKALVYGYHLLRVYKTYYFKKTCRPFDQYVNMLYEIKKQSKGTPMYLVSKILMNSLYGKFGQKFEGRTNYIPLQNIQYKDIAKYKIFEIIGDHVRVGKDEPPKPYCIPEWCSYVTAYARTKLFNALIQYEPIYYDTDSIITKYEIPEGSDLGEWKLEKRIKRGIFVKPKFYYIEDYEGNSDVIIKGVPKRDTRLYKFENFKNILLGEDVKYMKFCKFKESQRRGFLPNEILDQSKNLDLNDNKRIWPTNFKMFTSNGLISEFATQKSRPLCLEHGILRYEPEMTVKYSEEGCFKLIKEKYKYEL